MAYVFHVTSEEEINVHLDRLWKEHHNATHICYAWRLGWDKNLHRVNDDGEPSGTAGRPIFGQIQSFDLTNILAAVVRYYGGTKLGTGGLIDAYKTATKLALDQAVIIEKEVMDRYKLQFTHAQMPGVMKLLKELDMEKISASFDLTCEIEFRMRKSWVSRMMDGMEDLGVEAPDFLGTA